MKKLFLLAVGLTATKTLFPCISLQMMFLDDTAIKSTGSQNRNVNSYSSEPLSPVDPATLMPHSSTSTIRLAALWAKKQANNTQNSQQNSSTAG